jgi:hypothetical protein
MLSRLAGEVLGIHELLDGKCLQHAVIHPRKVAADHATVGLTDHRHRRTGRVMHQSHLLDTGVRFAMTQYRYVQHQYTPSTMGVAKPLNGRTSPTPSHG